MIHAISSLSPNATCFLRNTLHVKETAVELLFESFFLLDITFEDEMKLHSSWTATVASMSSQSFTVFFSHESASVVYPCLLNSFTVGGCHVSSKTCQLSAWRKFRVKRQSEKSSYRSLASFFLCVTLHAVLHRKRDSWSWRIACIFTPFCLSFCLSFCLYFLKDPHL